MGPISTIHATTTLSTLAIGLGVLASSAYAINPTETAKLVEIDNEESAPDLVGIAVSGSGDRMIVGASGNSVADFSAGAAFIYRFDGTDWVQEALLVTADAGVFDRFGGQVDIQGDWAVVGAPARRPEPSPESPQTGAAYIFHFDGTAWTEHTMFLPETLSREHMGSVALDGNMLAIGASTSIGKGAVYMYEFDGTDWAFTQKVIAPDGVFEDFFGSEVGLSNNKMVVSAQAHDPNGVRDAGAAYVFAFDGSTWNFEAKLVASDAAQEDWLGAGLDIDGDRVVAGASRHNIGAEHNNGAVYIFDFDGTSWNQTAKLLPDDTAQFDYFGFSVSIDNDLIAIGAESQNNSNGFGAGAVYLFEFDGTSWNQESKVLASDGANQDSFGYSVYLNEGWLFAGAPFHDAIVEQPNAGAAYVFDLNQTCSSADFAEPFGDLNFFDVSAFLVALSAGDLAADLNSDGKLNFFDISEFLIAFNAGCP